MALSIQKPQELSSVGTTSPPSDESLVQDLIIALSNPMSSPICSLRMYVAAERIQSELDARIESVSSMIKFSKSLPQGPQLLRASIKFLTQKQPRELHNAMLEHLSTCRCAFHGSRGGEMWKLHEPNRIRRPYKPVGGDTGKPFMLVMQVVETISSLLSLVLTDMTNGRFRSENSKFDPGKQPWPQNEHDLLPHGPADSIDGLDLWVTKPGGWTILRLCTALATVSQPFAQALFRPPQYTFVLERPIAHITAMVDSYDTIPQSQYGKYHPHIDIPMEYCFNYWQILMAYVAPRFTPLLNTQGNVLAPVLARVLPIVSVKEGTGWIEIRHFALGVLLRHTPPDANGIRKYQGIELKWEDFFKLGNEESVLVENYLDIFVTVRKGVCFNITCPNVETDAYSKLCSKCRLFRFCDEKCQKQAWRNTGIPHKTLCDNAAALKERLGVRDWADFGKVRDTPPGEFIALCRSKGVQVRAFLELGAVVHGVREAKNIYQKKVLERKMASRN